MRTSNQLTKIDQCSKHPHVNITHNTAGSQRAAAQKSIIRRMMEGEPILDIGEEIDSVLLSKDCTWENREQQIANLNVYKARITRFMNWITGQNYIFPDEMDDVVDFFGEEIHAKADFFIEEGNKVYVTKLLTGRFHSEADDIQQNEAYALGLLGEKLFPGKEIHVKFCHLGDSSSEREMAGILRSYDDSRYQKISDLAFTERTKEYFADKHEEEQENEGQCTPEECAACSMYNVCHYEEPPIALPVEKSVKPISEIRLTGDQRKVVEYERGVARINAGAGAGKTLVVAMRIVELLKKGYKPEDICLLTFTKAGAEEMTARVIQYCAGEGILIDPDRFVSTTFNAFCQKTITTFYEDLGYTAPPRVLPEETRSGIINRLLDQFPRVEEWNYQGLSSNDKFNRWAKNKQSALLSSKELFSRIKKEGYTRMNHPEEYDKLYSPVSLDIIFQMYEEYDAILHRRNFVEYDDQILETFKLLEIRPDLFNEIVVDEENGEKHGFRHIIVDEFQDTDLPQINLLQKVIDNESFKSFMVVGDDSQSIFLFRHTSPEYMINFGDYFGHFDDFTLAENHRSAGNIIRVANAVNGLAREKVNKDLIATKADSQGPFINGFYTQNEEYTWIAEQIKRRIEAGETPSDIAVLMSDRIELTAMASKLTEMGIPSVLMNPIPFTSNSRVCALCTFFDSFRHGTTQGMLDYVNAAQHGILKGATAETLNQLLEEFSTELHGGEHTLQKFLEYAKALDAEEVDETYQNFLEKITYCTNMEELTEFFRDFDLYGQNSMSKREGKYEGVCLTTIHSAKGLEWDTTFLSMSHLDKMDYHKNAYRFETSPERDEVYRKWFVGTTRARENLYMTGTFTITKGDDPRNPVLNRYLKEGFDILGKNYVFSPAQLAAVKAQEKAEEMTQRVPSVYTGAGYFRNGANARGQEPSANGESRPARRPIPRTNPFLRPNTAERPQPPIQPPVPPIQPSAGAQSQEEELDSEVEFI